MATLTETAIKARQGIKYGIILIIALFILRYLFGIGKSIYLLVRPPQPPPPDVKFDVLPAIAFPDPVQEFPEITYTIETADNTFPAFSDRATVYLMPPSRADLFSVDTANKKAQAFGFTNIKPVQLSETLYRYNNSAAPSAFEINVVSGIFTISYNLAFDPTPLAQVPPDEFSTERTVRSLLSSAQTLPEDFEDGDSGFEFLKVEGQNLVSVSSLSEADITKVNLYRKSYNELKPVTANPKESNVWLMLSGAQRPKQVIAAQFYYFPVDEEQFGEYPIKTAEQAFNDLQEGRGFIASLGTNLEGNVTIRNIYLAYYDPNLPSQFYQPVVVFEGDNGFVAYVPAVTDEFYTYKSELTSPAPEPSATPSGETATQE